MTEKSWYLAIKGAFAYWLAGTVFILVGAVFVVVGALTEQLFLFIGVPFLCLGILVITLLIYSLHLKAKYPENYETWLWWVNFIGGLSGALLFGIPSTLTLPTLLILGWTSKILLIGATFSAIGLAVMIAVWLVGKQQYRQRPRWIKPGEKDRPGGKQEYERQGR